MHEDTISVILKHKWVIPLERYKFEQRGCLTIADVDNLFEDHGQKVWRINRKTKESGNRTEIGLENTNRLWTYPIELFRCASEEEMHKVRGRNLAEDIGIL